MAGIFATYYVGMPSTGAAFTTCIWTLAGMQHVCSTTQPWLRYMQLLPTEFDRLC